MPGPGPRFKAGNTSVTETTINNIINQEFLTQNGYTSIAEILEKAQAAGGVTIALGDIGNTEDTTVQDHINGLVGTSYTLEANKTYFFTAEVGDFDHLYLWEGVQPIVIGEGGTAVTANDFKVLVIADRTQPEIPDYSLPYGLSGQLHFVTEGKKVAPDYIVKRGIVTETAEEFAAATATGITLEEVFNSWLRFSHSGSKNLNTASPPNYPGLDPSGFGGTPLTPQIWNEKKAWGFDAVNDRIFLTQNFGTFSGFVSPANYINYTLEASLSSTNGDDDYMGLVLAFLKDPVTGVEYTISAIRNLNQPGQDNFSYAIFFNFFQNRTGAYPLAGTSQIKIADGTLLAPELNANGWPQNPTKLRVERTGDNFSVKTSQFGSDVIDDATELTFSLNDLPELERFKAGAAVGFAALSQANAFFSNVSFTGFTDYILDLQNGLDAPRIFEYDFDLTDWVENAGLSYADVWGINRFVYGYNTQKTYWLGPDEIIKINAPAQAGGNSLTVNIGTGVFDVRKNPNNAGAGLEINDYAYAGSPENGTWWSAAIYLGGDPTLLASWNPIQPESEIPQL